MNDCFPKEIKFKGKWRPYQSRVLEVLEEHLDDRRLHVIAAPGSGKTILGLEAILRLNRPTLIVSPTLAIRDQWIQRFKELFLPEGSLPSWISTDVRKPGLLTSTTYQGLHMAYCGQELKDEEGLQEQDSEEEAAAQPADNAKDCAQELIALLNQAQIQTLVVDEAHHLRSEWWKTLTQVRQALKQPRTIALTATPPYDVTYQEWTRYQEFCGPVDEEISVPELVLAGNLCPHQDYVYLSVPTAKESAQIEAFHSEVAVFCREILEDEKFKTALENHPALADVKGHEEIILAEPEYYTAIIIYLNRIKGNFPRAILSLLGVAHSRIPALSAQWLETLLSGALYEDELLPLDENDLKRLRQRLSRIGVIERRKVFLKDTKQITKSLMQSMSKLDSIVQIARLEQEVMGADLRMVILSDFIRYEDLPLDPGDLKPLNRMGVIPIFEGLRRSRVKGLLGCLCGTVVIVPWESQDMLRKIAADKNIDPGKIAFKKLSADEKYCEVFLEAAAEEQAVALVTQLFTQGGINILVGTKSLLGEGWDAPCINSLVLASFVGSFVLSNQMRGRAIRACPGVPLKTANIWHLACLRKPVNPLDLLPGYADFGPDWETMQRRFKAFVGVSNSEASIQNGFDRMGLDIESVLQINAANENTCRLARDRKGLRDKWEQALKRGAEGVRLVQEVEAPKESVPHRFIFQNTLRWLMFQGAYWGFYVFSRFNPHGKSWQEFFYGYFILGLVSLAAAAPFFIKSLWLYLRYGPIEGSVKQIGEALLRTLVYLNFIKTDPQKLGVTTSRTGPGWISCYLEGGSSFEKSMFLDALQEILGPVANPRYMITRNSTWLVFLRVDYHAVPEIIGERKEQAEYFEKMWRKYVGPAGLIYTRSDAGRKILIKARNRSLSGEFRKKAQRLSAWK